MASMTELRSRLRARFKDVPGVEDADLDAWLTEAVYIYGYTPDTVDQIPDVETPRVLLLAQIQGARAIAIATAHYFKYTDAEESIDKTGISERYRILAADLTEEYEREYGRTSAFAIAPRVDRPPRRRPVGWWFMR